MHTHHANAEDAPLFCDSCPVGGFALYGRVFNERPSAITALRSLRKRFDEGQLILRDGEVPSHVYTVFSGWAYRYAMLPEGGRHVLAFYIPGDLLVLNAMSDGKMAFPVKALTEVVACGFERNAFFEFFSSSGALQRAMMVEAAGRLRDSDSMVLDYAKRAADVRLARFFFTMGERLKARGLTDEHGYELPVPQAVLADALGMTPVYLNRLLVILRDRGIVDLARKRIHVRDWPQLRAVVNEGGLR